MSKLYQKTDHQKNIVINLFKQGNHSEALQKLSHLSAKRPRDHELYYIEGVIRGALFEYVDATRCFQKALQLNSTHAESEFELGVIQMKMCRFNAADRHLTIARRKKSLQKECDDYLLKIKEVTRDNDVRLSACLIVKNEEKLLPGCLKSLQAICDELVVVDTGSEDNTVKIAEDFGAKVAHYKWKNDFADARNFALSQATGEWIIHLDADEELFPQDQCKVREIIHQASCDAAYLALHNRLSGSFGEARPTVHYLVRLFKKRVDFYYEHPIHETLRVSGEVTPVDINIMHHGYNLDTDYMLSKRRRNAKILYKKLQENPKDPSTLFYLSMMHLGNREFDLAGSYALKALPLLDAENSSKQHLSLMLLNNLATVASEQHKFEEVQKYARRAIQLNQDYLDPYFPLGAAHFTLGEFEEALEVFKEYLRRNDQQVDQPLFNLFGNSRDTYLDQVRHLTGKVYRKLKDNEKAKYWLQKAVDGNPEFWIGRIELAYIAVEEKDLLAASEHFHEAIVCGKKNQELIRENKALWFDFTQAIRNYVKTLDKLKRQSGEVSREKNAPTS